jgi:type IV pilus assembly protein PilM
MGLFGWSKKSYVGVDLGGGGIKVVELISEKKRARLNTYGFTERAPDAEPLNLIDAEREAGELLGRVFKKAKVTNNKAVAGLPIASVFSSVITVPKGTDADLQEAIKYQAKKLIPVPLEDMVLDFRPIRPDPKKAKAEETRGIEAKTVPVLITGASRPMVQKYLKVFKLAGLELESLETEAFGLIRSLIGKDRSTSMIVDIGAVRTNIIIVENGIPYVTRSLDLGGITLTRVMAKAVDVSLREAEQMKRDVKSVQTIYPGEGIPKIFATAIAPLLTELRYSMNLYAGQDGLHHGAAVEKIILTGGTAALPSLSLYFAKELGIRTYVGDPWARVAYQDEMRPLLDEIGPRFSVAVGLAMRDLD